MAVIPISCQNTITFWSHLAVLISVNHLAAKYRLNITDDFFTKNYFTFLSKAKLKIFFTKIPTCHFSRKSICFFQKSNFDRMSINDEFLIRTLSEDDSCYIDRVEFSVKRNC